MARTCLFWISLISLTALAGFTLACGGSSNTPPPTACTGTFNVIGDWQGTATEGTSSDPLVGVINSSGHAVFFDSVADIAVLPGITGACSFSGTLTAYASLESPGGVQTVPGTATGNVNSATSITGSDVANGTTTALSFSTYTPLSTLTPVSGNTSAFVEGQVQDLLSLAVGGTTSSITFSGSGVESGCTVNGTLTEEGANNVYDVTYDISGTNAGCTGNLTGVGFESSSDLFVGSNNPGTYVYAIITSGTSAPFVVEIVPSGGDVRDLHHQPNPASRRVFGFNKHESQ